MPSKSKNKGNGYERVVAKFLSETYADSFIKAPGSGAMVGGTNSHRKLVMTEGQVMSFKGDIVPPDNWVKFHCEAKFYKDFPFHQLFLEKCGKLDEWIKQVREAEDEGDFNLILMKFNFKGQWVCFEDKHGLNAANSLQYKEWQFCAWENFWTDQNIKMVKELSTTVV